MRLSAEPSGAVEADRGELGRWIGDRYRFLETVPQCECFVISVVPS